MTINWLAILVAAIAQMVIGMIWYSPKVFGKSWMMLSGLSMEKMNEMKAKGMGKKYFVAFIASLVMAYVLAVFLSGSATAVSDGLQAGFWLWIGFVAPVIIGPVLWEGKSVKLYLINSIHYLVTLMVMGGILAVWH